MSDDVPAAADLVMRPRSPLAIALDAARHALPLALLYLRHGSLPSYLLLTAFDLSLGLLLIVGSTRDARDPTTVDPRATWLVARLTAILVLAVFFAIVAAFITIPIGMPALIFGLATGVDWREMASQTSFQVSVVGMALMAAVRAQHRFEAVTTPGEVGTSPHAAPIMGDLEGDRRRSRAEYAAQVTLIGTYVALCYGLGLFGRAGFYVLPVLYTALLVFYDARPDLGRRIFPELWRGTRR